MTGIEIEYFWGIYFLVGAINFGGSRTSDDTFRLIAGIVLIAMAFLGITLVR